MTSEMTSYSSPRVIVNENQLEFECWCQNNNSITTNVTETKQKTVVQNEETSLICHICSEHFDTKEKLNKHTLIHSAAISQIFNALCLPENLTATYTDVDCGQCTKAVIAEKTNKNATPRITENTTESGNVYDNSNEVNNDQISSSRSGQILMNNKDENADLSKKEQTVARFLDKENNFFVPPNALTKGYSERIEKTNEDGNSIDDTDLSFVIAISTNDSKRVADKTDYLSDECYMTMEYKIDDLEEVVCKNKCTNEPAQISISEMISNTRRGFIGEMLDESTSLKPNSNSKVRDIREQAMKPLEIIETDAVKILNSCGFCKKVFTRKYSLDRHVQNIHKLKVVKGKFNETDLHDNSSVVSKVNNATVETENEDHNTRRTLNVQYLLRTSRRDSKDKPSPTNALKYAPDQHVLTDNIRRKKTYICYVCGLKAPSCSLLKDHILIHAAEKGFTCETCNRSFKRQQELNRHTRTVHAENKPKKEITCETCNRSFKRQQELNRHTWTVHAENKPKKEIACETCNRSFKRQQELNRHTWTVHAENKPKKEITCETCNRSFKRQQELNRHTWTVHAENKPKKEITCETCNRSFKRQQELNRHTWTVHAENKPKKEITCETCNRSFKRQQELNRHTRTVHAENKPKKEIACETCNRSFKRQQELNRHTRTVHAENKPKKEITCETCNRSFKRQQELNRHTWTVHAENKPKKEIKCNTCCKLFLRTRELARHTWVAHGGKKKTGFKCNICSKLFSRTRALSIHTRVAHGEKKKTGFKCQICSRLFSRTRQLARHTRVAHVEKKKTGFKCHICSRLFSRQLLYQRHLMTHTGEKPDPCPVCNKFFRGPKDLKVHLRTHEDKRYACEICGKKISTLDVLQKHLLIHSGGEKNLICDVCGERFMWPTSLYRHKQIHHGGKEYRCDFCNRASRVKGSLNDHMRGHFGLRKFPCSICNKLFITKKHLKNHVSTHSSDRCLKCMLCDKSFRQKVVLKYHMFSHTGYQPFSCENI